MTRTPVNNKLGFSTKQLRAASMLADGHSTKDIAIVLFDCRDEHGLTDPKKVRNGMEKIRKWTKMPGFYETFREYVREAILPDFARAYKVLGKQLDNENAWLQNKAANDILTRFGPQIMGEDTNQITVRVEGMPALGTPDRMETLPVESTDLEDIHVSGDVK